MVELIKGNPYLDAFNKGQKRRASSAATGAALRRDEQAMEDAEVTRIRGDNYDRALADLLRKREGGGLRTQGPEAPSPTVSQALGAREATARPQPEPARVQPIQQGVTGAPSPAPAPANGGTSVPESFAVTPGGGLRRVAPNTIRSEAMLSTPGYRDQGLQVLEQQREKESEQLQKIIEISTKSPEAAAAYAQQERIELHPNVVNMLRVEWFRNWLATTEKQMATTYKGDPVGYEKAMMIAMKNLADEVNQNQGVPSGIPDPYAGKMPTPNPRPTGKPVQVMTPKGPVWTSPQTAIGQPAPPKGTGITLTREAINEEIDQDREYLQMLHERMPPGTTLRKEIIRLSREVTDTGRVNPEYDPDILRALRKAWRRKVGGDAGFDEFRQLLNTPKPEPAQMAPAAAAPVSPEQSLPQSSQVGMLDASGAQAAEPSASKPSLPTLPTHPSLPTLPTLPPTQPDAQGWMVIEGRQVRQVGTSRGMPIYEDEAGSRFTIAPGSTN